MTKRIYIILFQIALAVIGFVIGIASLVMIAIGVSCLGECSGLQWQSIGWLAFLLPVVIPLVLVRLVFFADMSIKFTAYLLTMACILDLLLVVLTLEEKLHFSRNSHLPQGDDFKIIIGLWSVWQILALLTLILQFRAKRKLSDKE